MSHRMKLAVCVWSCLAFAGCGGGPFAPPAGSQLTVNPGNIIYSSGGEVVLVEAIAQDEEGNLLNNIEVIFRSYEPDGFVLVPWSALVKDTNASTTWSVSAEEYYQTLEVDDQIQPDDLRTVTNDYGVARAYLYGRCLPTTCMVGDELVTSCNADDFAAQLAGKTCAGLTDVLYVTIGVAAESVSVNAPSIVFLAQ